MPLLFVVEDVFVIKERGVIAAGQLADPDRARYRIGDPVEVRHSDGSVTRAVISGIPLGMHAADKADVLLRGVGGSDVRVGDQVWASEPSAEPGSVLSRGDS
jgi:translation elongation factor EF-Tu-like GTPase